MGASRACCRCSSRTSRATTSTQFKDMATQVVLTPPEYASGKVIYPYEKAK